MCALWSARCKSCKAGSAWRWRCTCRWKSSIPISPAASRFPATLSSWRSTSSRRLRLADLVDDVDEEHDLALRHLRVSAEPGVEQAFRYLQPPREGGMTQPLHGLLQQGLSSGFLHGGG